MNSEEQKLLLKLACACDRLELALAHCAPPEPAWKKVVAAAGVGPLAEIASSAAMLLLPRKLRFLLAIFRSWQRRE